MECNNIEMGKRIARRRKQLKIRQNNFAEAIGISNNHLIISKCNGIFLIEASISRFS